MRVRDAATMDALRVTLDVLRDSAQEAAFCSDHDLMTDLEYAAAVVHTVLAGEG